MNPYLIKFIQDVQQACTTYETTLDESYNIIYTQGSRVLVIPADDIEKYYHAYIMSHQPRAEAILRASKYVERTIKDWAGLWSNMGFVN